LIFKHESLNLEQILTDLLFNTVIEIPQFQVSVNILDTFISRVFSTTSLLPRTQTHPTASSPFDTASLVPTIGLEKLPRRCREHIRNIVREMPADTIPKLNLKALPLTRNHLHRHHLASKWGLYQLVSWKVSREFAAAHPEIDCSTSKSIGISSRNLDSLYPSSLLTAYVSAVMSRYPMCSSALVPEV
jgi:hypothetical protein